MTGPPLLAPTIPSAAYGFPQPNMHYVLQGKKIIKGKIRKREGWFSSYFGLKG
jgi:hypothetical protein